MPPDMDDREFTAFVETLAGIASEAGRVILDVYDTPFAAKAKADASPVTEADLRAEALILERLAQIAPAMPVVAEESVARGAVPRLRRDVRYLLVDPLDGTREFLARNGEFTVNIAVMADDTPVAGIVYAPARGILYAGDGATAWKAQVAAGERVRLAHAARIRTRTPPRGEFVAVASRTHMCERTRAWLAAHGVTACVQAGSALKFGLIAEGAADVYPRFTDTMEWDVAAGHAVVASAGGCLSTPDGGRFVYRKRRRKFRNGPFVVWGRDPSGAVA